MTEPSTLPHPSCTAVLSAAIMSDEAARRITTDCAAEVFSGDQARIYTHLVAMLKLGIPVEPMSVMAACVAGPHPQQTCAALTDLVTAYLPLEMVGWHVAELAKIAGKQRLRMLATTAQQMADSDEPNLALLRDRLDAVTHVQQTLPPTVASMVDDHLAQLDAEEPDVPAVPTGLDGLDRLLNGGLRAGQLVVVGARTGVGKSVLLMHIARHAALRCNTTVLFGSLEMTASEVLDRYIAAETRTDVAHLIGRNMTTADWSRIAERLAVLTSGRLHLVDGPSQTVSGLAAQARAVKAGLIVVDYLQLLRPEQRTGNREQDVAALSRSLKVLAGTAGCPVIVASQVRRAPAETKGNPPPTLSDLRESGAIEQDANVVLLLHRDPNDELLGTTADLIVAKNRSGPLGTVDLAFHGHHTSFEEAPKPTPGRPWDDDEPPEEHYR